MFVSTGCKPETALCQEEVPHTAAYEYLTASDDIMKLPVGLDKEQGCRAHTDVLTLYKLCC